MKLPCGTELALDAMPDGRWLWTVSADGQVRARGYVEDRPKALAAGKQAALRVLWRSQQVLDRME
jgi:hypothetical protein